MGNLTIPKSKQGGVTKEMQISQFGLDSKHAGLLGGCSLNPVLQSSMRQSLGPMTVAIIMCMTEKTTYLKNWKQTFSMMFKNVPCHAELAAELAGSKAMHVELLRKLADLSLCGVTRNSNKAFLPMGMQLEMMRSNKAYVTFFAGGVGQDTPITDNMVPPNITNLDFSGKGLYAFWNALSSKTFGMRAGNTMTKEMGNQWLYHSVFGSHVDDLAIPEFQTGLPFMTRRDFGDAFQGRGTGQILEVKPLRLKYVSKLASASQTNKIK